MSIQWQAVAKCECGETSEMVAAMHPFRSGCVDIASKPEGWSTNPVRCPACLEVYNADVKHRSRSVTSSGGRAPVVRYPRDDGKPGEGDTSNSTEARRGDSRFYTIDGQLVPPSRGR